MTTRKGSSIAAFLLASMLGGCATVPGVPGPTADPTPEPRRVAPADGPAALRHLPPGALREPDERTIDMQLALWDRGTYLNYFGEVVPAAEAPCGDLRLEAHRGDPDAHENTLSSIQRAAEGGFDSVEIDVMRLFDGTWVLHHDTRTGRATGRRDGQRERLDRMFLPGWRALQVRDTNTGRLVDERPPTLAHALHAFRLSAPEGQILNIDIKSKAGEGALYQLNAMVHRHLGAGRYSYSSGDLETLRYLRTLNPDVYLGLIQSPHRESLRILRARLQGAVSQDPLYERNREALELSADVATWWYGVRARDHTSTAALRRIHDTLGPNAGLHLDVRRYAEVPGLRQRARAAGLRQVATYTINAPEYHEDAIRSLKQRGRAPDIAIMDSSVYQFCGRIAGLPEPRGDYTPRTPAGELIAALPAEADLRDLETQATYAREDLYLTLDSGVRALSDARAGGVRQAATSGSARPDFSLPERVEGGEVDFGESSPIRIRLEE